MQKAVTDAPDAPDAPASSSTKNVAPFAKSKKKSFPLDAIRNDPEALYALLSKMVKDDEAANSDDEKSSHIMRGYPHVSLGSEQLMQQSINRIPSLQRREVE